MDINTIKTDNGWYHINDLKPHGEEEVIIVLERESSEGCTYEFSVCESIYRHSYPQGYFLAENNAWKVRYWRRKEIYPYPTDVVRKEIEECKKRNVNPYKIIAHQKMCGIESIG